MDLAQRLRPEHFDELADLVRGQPFEGVPLWLWSPIVTRQECERVAAEAESLGRELLELGLRERRAGREDLWLPDRPGLLESIRSDPWDTDPTFHWRFDFLWDRRSGEIAFLEVNSGDPSGLGWVDSFTQTMRSHSLWNRAFETGQLFSFELGRKHLAALERELGPGPHAVTFLAAEGSTVASDIACWADIYRRCGYRARVADPRRMGLRDDGVWLEGERQAAILRDTYEELYQPPYEGVGAALSGQARAGKVRLFNPLCASFWDSKLLWTRLTERPTVPRTILPRPLPSEQRRDWVLKPAFDYGGRGVLCGFSCDPERWDGAVARALEQPREWILQRAATPSVERFPILGPDRKVRWEKRYLTWSVFLNHLKFSGLIARAGSNPVVNVHNGGAIFPVYVRG